MSEQVVKSVHGVPFVFGAIWFDGDAKPTVREAIAAGVRRAKSEGATYVLHSPVSALGGDEGAGYTAIFGYVTIDVPKGALFAGRAIGQVFPNGFAGDGEIWPGQDAVWVCRLKAGWPLAGSDYFSDASGAQEALREAIRTGDSTHLGQFVGSECSVADALERFAKSWQRVSRADRRGQVPVRVPGAWLWLRYVVVLLVLLAIGAGAAWFWKSRLAEQVARAKSIRDIALTQQTVAEQERRLVGLRQQFDASVAAARLALSEKGATGLQLWSVAQDARRALPISIGGFQPSRLECSNDACTATWVASNALVDLRAGDYIPHVLPVDGLPAERSSVIWRGPAARPAEVLDDAMSHRDWLLLSHGRAPGLTFDAPTQVTVSAPAGLSATAVVVGSRGAFRATTTGGMALIQAEDVARALDLGGLMSLESVKFVGLNSLSPSVEMAGYYVAYEASSSPGITVADGSAAASGVRK